MQEVDREDRLGLSPQERAPPFVAGTRRGNAVGSEDLANGAGADPMSEPTQLTLERNLLDSEAIIRASESRCRGPPGGLTCDRWCGSSHRYLGLLFGSGAIYDLAHGVGGGRD